MEYTLTRVHSDGRDMCAHIVIEASETEDGSESTTQPQGCKGTTRGRSHNGPAELPSQGSEGAW